MLFPYYLFPYFCIILILNYYYYYYIIIIILLYYFYDLFHNSIIIIIKWNYLGSIYLLLTFWTTGVLYAFMTLGWRSCHGYCCLFFFFQKRPKKINDYIHKKLGGKYVYFMQFAIMLFPCLGSQDSFSCL